jgi:large subunit ribosomal protein L21
MKSQEKETPTTPSDKVIKAGDDLTIIEGIGSRISYVLYENDILTFNDLATANIDVLNDLMKQYNLDFAKPTIWSKQAQLAAEGKIDELEALKSVLKSDI